MRIPILSRPAWLVGFVIALGVVPSFVYLFLLRPAERLELLLRERSEDLQVVRDQTVAALQSRLSALQNQAEQRSPQDSTFANDGSDPWTSLPPYQGTDTKGLIERCSSSPSSESPVCLLTRQSEPILPHNSTTHFDPTAEPAMRSVGVDVFFVSPSESLVSKLSLADSIHKFLGDSSLAKYELFVVDPSGDVLVHHGPGDLEIRQFPRSKPEPTKPAANPSDPAKTAEPTKAAAADSVSTRLDATKTLIDLPPIDQLVYTSVVRTVRVGDTEYRLLSVPASVPTKLENGTQDHAVWVFAVLIPEARLHGLARSFSYGSWSAVPLLAILCLLGAPLLKVGSTGTYQPFGRFDRLAVLIAVVLAPSLTFVVATWIAGYSVLDVRLDDELAKVSSQIRGNFDREIGAAREALSAAEASAPGTNARCRASYLGQDPPLYYNCTEEEKVQSRTGYESAYAAYPYFEYLMWADETGVQLAKWSVEEAPPLSDDTRSLHPFFGQVLDGTLSSTIHTQLSPWTGQAITVLTEPWRYPYPSGTKTGLKVMVFSPLSLLKPILPPGFSFAVVETDGKVIYHNLTRRSLQENFFEEVEDGDRLRSLVASHREGVIESTYHGRTYRMMVRRLPHMPWLLITYRDKEIPRSIDLDVMVTWASLLTFVLLVAAAMAGAHFATRRPLEPAWWWPDPARAHAYREACAVLLVSLFVEILVLCFPYAALEEPPTAAWMVLPALLLSYFHLRLRRVSGVTQRSSIIEWTVFLASVGACVGSLHAIPDVVRCVLLIPSIVCCVSLCRSLPATPFARDRLRRWFAWSMTLTILAAAVLPATILFRSSFEAGMDVLTRSGQLEIAERLAIRNQRIKGRYIVERARSYAVAMCDSDPYSSTEGYDQCKPENFERAKDRGTKEILPERLKTVVEENTWQFDIAARGLWWDGDLRRSTHDEAAARREIDWKKCACPVADCTLRGPSVADCNLTLIGWENERFVDRVMACLPVYHSESIRLRKLAYDSATFDSGGALDWCSQVTQAEDDDQTIALEVFDDRLGGDASARSGTHVVLAGSQRAELSLPRLLRPEDAIAWGWGILLLFVATFVWALHSLVQWLARRLCGLGAADIVRDPQRVIRAGAQWQDLPEEVRVLLTNLATTGYLTPSRRAWEVARKLEAVGILSLQPHPCFVSEDMRAFACSERAVIEAAELGRLHGNNAWNAIRGIGIVAAIFVGVVVYFTQRESITQWSGALTAVGGLLGSLVTLGSLLRSKDAQSKG